MMREKEIFKFYIRRVKRYTFAFVKWGICAIVTGLVVGAISSVFTIALKWVNDFREENTWLIFLLPLAGIVIVFLYDLFEYKNDKGTNMVITTLQAKTELPFRMAPLIFISTLITHLFGGSAGREGAALQLGGSVGNQLGRWFRLDEDDRRIVVMCGMSAAFATVFGTPISAVIFALEIGSVGMMNYVALVPCVFASLIASKFAKGVGIYSEVFFVKAIPPFDLIPSVKIILLAVCCAILSITFCVVLHGLGDFYREKFKNPYVRIVVSSLIIIGLTLLVGNDDYMGAGVGVIEKAIKGKVVPYSFILKIIFTALTLEAGFKGGEIVPSFFVGATFGCLFGNLMGVSPPLCAAVGMISVFCGVTNCPLTSLIIAFELFGYVGVPYFLLAISVSYFLSGYYGLYQAQKIVYAKYHPERLQK